VSTPKLICDRDIAQNDTFAEMFDEAQPVFSATTVREFLDLHKDATEIELEVRSDGGSTSEARIIYDMLKGCGKTITTHGYKVNSSAMILFLAGENRLIAENSDAIIHPVWVDAFGLPWKLEANDLRLFANEIEQEQVKLVDIYCKVIGEDKRDEVTALMAATTNLTSNEAIRLGFATGKLEGAKAENSKRSVVYTNKMLQAALMNKINQNKESMAKDETRFDKMLDTLNKMATAIGMKNEGETKNASAELSEGGSVYFDGDLGVGTAVFTDETMETPAPEGEHSLADGRTIVVADGAVSEINAADSGEEPADNSEEVAALNAKITALENANAEILANQTKQADAMNKVVDLLSGMKNIVVGDGSKEKRKPAVAKDFKDMSNFEKLKYNESKGKR